MADQTCTIWPRKAKPSLSTDNAIAMTQREPLRSQRIRQKTRRRFHHFYFTFTHNHVTRLAGCWSLFLTEVRLCSSVSADTANFSLKTSPTPSKLINSVAA